MARWGSRPSWFGMKGHQTHMDHLREKPPVRGRRLSRLHAGTAYCRQVQLSTLHFSDSVWMRGEMSLKCCSQNFKSKALVCGHSSPGLVMDSLKCRFKGFSWYSGKLLLSQTGLLNKTAWVSVCEISSAKILLSQGPPEFSPPDMENKTPWLLLEKCNSVTGSSELLSDGRNSPPGLLFPWKILLL